MKQPKNEIKNLVSMLLLVSIANLISPQLLGAPLDTEKIENNILSTSNQAQTEQVIFAEPLSPDFEEYIEHTIIGQTSFVSLKTPPNKKHVVVSRMWLFVTAYSSTPDQTDDSPFITASGNRVRDGIIAANFLSLYTKVRFPTLYGDKIFVVEDRMNSRYHYRADIWMPTRWQAQQFGLRNVPIEVIREI